MTYDASPLLKSRRNRTSEHDTSITTHEGIDTSAYSQINSSVITFTPTATANDIIYRYTCYINPYQASGPTGRNCRTHFRLQVDSGGGFTDIAGCESNEIFESAVSAPMCQRLLTLRFSVAVSTGSRQYRLIAKSFSSAYQSALHWTHFWQPYAQTSGNTTGMRVYYPIAEVREL